VTVPPSTFEEDLMSMFRRQDYADLVFLTGPKNSVVFHGHKFFLAAAWPALYPILKLNLAACCSNHHHGMMNVVQNTAPCAAGVASGAAGVGHFLTPAAG
jgi:hypothetical protein